MSTPFSSAQPLSIQEKASGKIGKGTVRPGVTAISRGKDSMNDAVFAGWFRKTEKGEMTGTTWVGSPAS